VLGSQYTLSDSKGSLVESRGRLPGIGLFRSLCHIELVFGLVGVPRHRLLWRRNVERLRALHDIILKRICC
jgi:hypothetical protein